MSFDPHENLLGDWPAMAAMAVLMAVAIGLVKLRDYLWLRQARKHPWWVNGHRYDWGEG